MRRSRKKIPPESILSSDDDVTIPPPSSVAPPSYESKTKKILVRTVMALFMIAFYLGMLRGGHFYCILVAVSTQIELFRELVNVRYVRAKERAIPLFRTIQWMWFALAMFYIYGDSFHMFCLEHRSLIHLTKITQYLDYIVFGFYCILFMTTVLTFKPGIIRFQLSQLMWTIATVFMVVGQCKFLASLVLNGLFWFFFPMATVVMNDVSAYFCGITMGRQFIKAPFISLSPNKTWEGFIGAAVLTLVFSFFFPLLLSQFSWFTCPAEELTIIPRAIATLSCDTNPVFLPTAYFLPDQISSLVGWTSITLRPIQLHGMIYGLFASLVAPFGGFLASAVKRAYGIKDFESFFPGHGGMMDRMDCQLLMLSFTWVHFNTFIAHRIPTLKSVFTATLLLPLEDQKLLHQMLGQQIENATLVDEDCIT